jgi:hypothetical protein
MVTIPCSQSLVHIVVGAERALPAVQDSSQCSHEPLMAAMRRVYDLDQDALALTWRYNLVIPLHITAATLEAWKTAVQPVDERPRRMTDNGTLSLFARRQRLEVSVVPPPNGCVCFCHIDLPSTVSEQKYSVTGDGSQSVTAEMEEPLVLVAHVHVSLRATHDTVEQGQ